jgi:Putative Flp pilus-assembly TadE/G-like
MISTNTIALDPSAVQKEKRRESGYVMTMMVLMMPVLLGFMALAVDATYYWFRGVQIQRAADAASLAGVTRMPKYEEAVRVATEIAKRNGFVDGEDNIVVTPQRVTDNSKRFKITIVDRSVGLFFGRIFQNSWTAQRTSTAEYISNIPLGSKENAIGTGYLTDSGPPPLQNFWLAVSGPCAPKEAGDQFMSRWDGNAVNGFEYDNAGNPIWLNAAGADVAATDAGAIKPKPRAASERYALLCDVDPLGIAPTGPVQIKADRDARAAGLFPGLVQNLEYAANKTGYDYIVDVPCYSATGALVPPPCDATSLPGDLVIQVFDPVFNPDSVQRWGQKVLDPLTGLRYTDEVKDRLKPDKTGLLRPSIIDCLSTSHPLHPAAPAPSKLDNCRDAASIGTGNPKGWDVRLNTDFRVYPPDNSPLDYSDDNAMSLDDAGAFDASTGNTTPNIVTGNAPLGTGAGTVNPTADKFVSNKEQDDKAVRRFKSCIALTDGWTSYDGANYYSVPQASDAAPIVPRAAGQPGVVGTPDATVLVTDTGTATASECAAYGSNWVTMKRVPASAKRGRYRLNIRTIDAPNSFGFNSFSIRAFFVPTSPPAPAPVVYPSCLLTVAQVCAAPAIQQTASVAGDSTMSVFASVNDVSRFYLAQLSPTKLFRNKTVVVSLWDPGEGADKLQILRPKPSTETCEVGLTDPVKDPVTGLTATNPVYCVQRIQWTVGRTGISAYSSTNQDVGLTNSVEYADVCADKGRPLPAETNNVDGVVVSGSNVAGVDGTTIDGCTVLQPLLIKKTRQMKADKTEQKFNDRLVTVAIKVPANYGCAVGTGIPDITSGNLIPCVETVEPEGGWWKIKYFPKPKMTIDPVTGEETTVPDPLGGYKKMTDRTTWTVGLRGDPVHLVVNGQ